MLYLLQLVDKLSWVVELVHRRGGGGDTRSLKQRCKKTWIGGGRRALGGGVGASVGGGRGGQQGEGCGEGWRVLRTLWRCGEDHGCVQVEIPSCCGNGGETR